MNREEAVRKAIKTFVEKHAEEIDVVRDAATDERERTHTMRALVKGNEELVFDIMMLDPVVKDADRLYIKRLMSLTLSCAIFAACILAVSLFGYANHHPLFFLGLIACAASVVAVVVLMSKYRGELRGHLQDMILRTAECAE